MKHINFSSLKFALLSLTLSFVSCQSKSQQTQNVTQNINTQEITWNPSIDDALAKAKSNNKLLFVECYSPTCPVCQSLEPFFKKSAVATKYNGSFENFKLDVGKAEVVKFLNARNIYLPSFPQFLFFDGDGNLVHQSEVTANTDSFLKAADDALNPDKRAVNYKKMFEGGNRNLDFLINYASYTRIIKDTTANIAVANEIFKVIPKEEIGTETGWKITKKAVTDMDNGLAKYWFDHYNVAKDFETKEGHPGNESNILGGIIQSSLFSKRGKEYSIAKLQEVKKNMAKIGVGQYADGVTWEYECRAYVREGQPKMAIPVAQKMAAKFSTNPQSLIYITHVLNEIYPNKEYAATAKTWLAKAKPLIKEDKIWAEYYLESANLNKKAGNMNLVASDVKLAKEYAAKAKIDMTRFNAL